ncbi:condensation domain-containing protein [Dactylosporangium sp. NBC_01737]|uniref:condensation domain-containing protein n=1 Tax=Dactylosporangium sp. NBC_01737 TaxID=2975959 RepID=UPI002E148ED9|nr:condensation domain-containing protein [Dactylosporangium sp. NBC_01737]
MTELLAPARVPFAGARSGSGPLTWGQRAIWHAIGRTVPNDHYFNLDRIVDLGPRTVPVDAALGALAALVARHEALRTRLGVATRQVLAADGVLDVHVVDGGTDPAAAAARVRDLLAGTAFDYRAEWPLRAALVTTGGAVSHLVLVLCHLATDGHGAEVLARDLRLLVRRGTRGLRAPETTPLDLAAEQHSPEGHRRGTTALAYWAEQFARIPATMFATPVAPPRTPRYWTGRIVSTVLSGAVDALAAQHGVSGSTVLLTAAGALAATAGGHPTTAVMPIVGNRFTTGHRDLVSTLSQDGLFVLDVDRPTFSALLRPGWQAALRGYRAAAYDPAAWDAMLADAAAARGVEVHPYTCFNDMRLVEGRPTQAATELRDTTFDFPATQDRVACRYCLHITSDGPALVVTLTADTAYLPPAAIEGQLRAIEELLVRAAREDVPMNALTGLL